MLTDPSSAQPLPPQKLRWKCDREQFDFQTTRDLPGLDGLLGQARAESAIEFGMGMRRDGYNLYVLGPPGSGKRTVIRGYLQRQARDEPRPSDEDDRDAQQTNRPVRLFPRGGESQSLDRVWRRESRSWRSVSAWTGTYPHTFLTPKTW